MEVGMRVRYIREDSEKDKLLGYYPPIGTLGTVEKFDNRVKGEESILVQWDSGTRGDGRWWCYCTDVEIVEGEE